jgi:hypothetical protein
MLNPIEEAIADIEREIRRLLSTILSARVLEIHALHWGQKTIPRRALLQTALAQAIGAITIAQVDSHFAHSYTFLLRALNGEHFNDFEE